MANPSLAPAPAALATLQPQTQQTLTQGKIITVPGIPGHFIQVFYTRGLHWQLCQAFDTVLSVLKDVNLKTYQLLI